VLLGVELLDELVAGVPAAGSPAIQDSFATSYATTAGILLLLPALIALVLEPIVFLAADRWPRRWFIRGGLFAMAGSALACACAPGPLTLALASGLGFVASGTAVALSQATLVDLHPGARERAMTRWALMGTVGDLGGPLLLAGLAAAGLGWRTGYVVVAALVAAWATLPLPEIPATPAAPDDDDDASLWTGLRLALRERRLLLWLGAAALCDLLDEIVIVFASLHLRDDLGAGPTERAVVLSAFVVGGVIGVTATDRLLARHPPVRLLAIASAACAVTYLLWLAAPTWWLSAIGMLAVGATAAPLYPIATAQCYAALPGRSGAVNAAGHLFTPVAMLLPWLLGALADRAGTVAALAVLVAQPIGIAVIAGYAARTAASADRAQMPGS
jgi:FSR family fosmidomycin resistance protein-like MFS transporter